ERERYLRLGAGIPTGATVDLSLVKLPEGALIFPCPPAPGEDFSFTKLRRPRDVTRGFKNRAAKLRFAKLRLHDLRGTHETLLLDAGVPVHVVAALILRSCCAVTPSERVKPRGRRRRLLVQSVVAFCPENGRRTNR